MLVNVANGLFFVLGVTILVRAVGNHHLGRYPFFYSYVIYILATGVVGWVLDLWFTEHFAAFFWVRFLTLVVAEFALLVEVGDHIFARYPVLLQLGRAVTLGVSTTFSVIYVLPPLLENRPSEVAVFDLVLRSALTKGFIILALAVMAGYFRIPLGKNIAGIGLGLVAYLSINIANFALVESLGWDSYGKVFSSIGPTSQTLMMLIWTVSLWRHEPVLLPQPDARHHVRPAQKPLQDRLGKYNSALDRLLRR